MEMTWVCAVCGETRPDDKISVHKKDLSKDHGFPPGTFVHNIKYCNDREDCIKGAPNVGLEKRDE